MSDLPPLASKLRERGFTFIFAAEKDANTIREAMFQVFSAVASDRPLKFTIKDGEASECKEIYMDGMDIRINQDTGKSIIPSICVLSVLNRYTFPVTPGLDSPRLSQIGKLDDAIDIRPFMFSGPAPTMVIWAGSGTTTVEELGYPTLTNEDAEQAFRYWLRYIFGVNPTEDWKLE